MSGLLIVIDGLDGSGKGTHTGLVEQQLLKSGYNAKKITFPDYNEPSSALVKMYLSGEFGNNPSDVNAYAASCFYAVDRYASYKKFWCKDLENGTIIIADRYSTSNAIHQMVKLPKDKWDTYLDWLYDFEFNKLLLPKPNLVLYLDMLPEISKKLIEGRYNGDETKKDIHESNFNYLLECREAALYAADKLNWTIIKLCDNKNAYSIEENFKNINEIILKAVELGD